MKYVAFLRAINVGGHVVKMDRLRALFEEMGFTNVETFIASGNVIFEARRTSEAKIEAALREALGYEVQTFVRTPAELAEIGKVTDAGGTMYVGFFAKPASQEAKKKVEALTTPTDELRVVARELYWLCRAPTLTDSTITGKMLEKALGQPATLRNISTVRKLAAKHT
jgi:uncharacterized protein (DUF1697 family)